MFYINLVVNFIEFVMQLQLSGQIVGPTTEPTLERQKGGGGGSSPLSPMLATPLGFG